MDIHDELHPVVELAFEHLKAGKESVAVDDMLELIRANPDCREARFWFAQILHRSRRYLRASQEYGLVYRQTPGDRLCHRGLALLYATCEHWWMRSGSLAVKHAFAYFESSDVVAAEGAIADSFALLAAAFAQLGNFERAVKLSDAAIASSPENMLKWRTAVLELYKMKRPLRLTFDHGRPFMLGRHERLSSEPGWLPHRK